MNKKLIFILAGFSVLILGSVFFIKKTNLVNWPSGNPMPSPIKYGQKPAAPTPAQQKISPQATINSVAEINLDVPFTSQAPNQNWNQPFQDFCEEASVLMAISYVRGQNISNPDVASAKMLEIKSFEENKFGTYIDTNADQTATIIKEFYKYSNVKLVYNPTIANIKEALVSGKAVLVPAAGRELKNPYFTAPGPLYHMLVIKGFTKDGRFITNDPGTRHGANYIYDAQLLWNSIHDWNGGNVNEGRKVMIVVG